MSFKGKKKSDTGTVFLSQVEGTAFYTGAFPGVGLVQMEINGDKDLLIKSATASEIVKPKSNSFGDFYVTAVGDKRYFISARENSKGPYLMAKIAPERPMDSAGRPQRPETYGARK